MSIPVTCPECGAINKVNDSLAGRRVRCPQCDTAVHVPEWDMGQQPPPLPAGADAVPTDEAVEAVPVEAVPVQAVAAAPAAVTAASSPPASSPPTSSPPASSPPASSPPASSPPTGSPAAVEEDEDEPVFKRKPRDEEELDMTPMVDVTFLLLIFFMVTAAFSLQKSIEMPRQQTDAPSTTVVEEEPEELEMVEVQVDEFGTFLVLAMDWEEETPGKKNLIAALKRAKEGGAESRLVIKVHEQCKLQFLVDAMDAGSIAGYAETQVTQVEEFD